MNTPAGRWLAQYLPAGAVPLVLAVAYAVALLLIIIGLSQGEPQLRYVDLR